MARNRLGASIPTRLLPTAPLFKEESYQGRKGLRILFLLMCAHLRLVLRLLVRINAGHSSYLTHNRRLRRCVHKTYCTQHGRPYQEESNLFYRC